MSKKILLAFILGISLFFNLYGIRWGLPTHWYPDEYETIEKTVIPMARNLDPNPHYFFKPSLYYYFLSFIMAPYFIYIKAAGMRIESYQNLIGTVTLIGRVATAFVGVLGVYVMYLLGRNLRDDQAGLIAAGFLAITLGYASYSHFAYYDIPMIALMLVSVYLCFRYLSFSKISFLYWASFVGGLAFSTKYNAFFFVGLTLLICYIHQVVSRIKTDLSWKSFTRNFLSKSFIFIIVLFILGFIIGTPFAVLDFKSFFRDVLEQFFTTKDFKGYQGKGIWFSNIVHLKMVLGLPMLIFLLMTFFYGVYRWMKKPNFAESIIIFIPLLSLAYMSTWRISAIRYVLPVVPFVILFSGSIASSSMQEGKIRKTVASVLLGMVIVYTIVFTWRGIRWFSNDTREIATQWIEKNFETESQVEVYGYLSYLPRFPDRVVLNKINPDYIPLSFSYESFKKSDLGRMLIGTGEDLSKRDSEDNRNVFTLQSLAKRNPDYIVLSSFYYQRYIPNDKTENQNLFPELNRYFQQLVSGEAGYQTIKIFKNENTGMEAYFLNPEVYILKKI